MQKKYIVTLTDEERRQLTAMLSAGKAAARTLTHARILLKADVGDDRPRVSDEAIAAEVMCGPATVERVRKQFVEEGFDAALTRRATRRVYRRKLDGDGEARLVALTCSRAPEGRGRWTLQLLADRLVQLGVVDTISYEAVRNVLKKRAQALVEQAVVHSAPGGRGLRVQDGRRAGRIQTAVRSGASGGVSGRDQQAVDRRGGDTDPDGARPCGPARLRVQT